MTERDNAIKRIQAAARKRDEADRLKNEATDELRRFCGEARKLDMTMAEIAHLAGLSRQGVYDLLSPKVRPDRAEGPDSRR